MPLALLGGVALAAQDRSTLSIPKGIAFSDFKGYEGWETVAVSTTPESIKTILANPVMIAAYKDGTPANGKKFPEGSKIVKIEWVKKANPVSPYAVDIPDTLKSLSFIEKDSKRFSDTHGWGYAQWDNDAKTATLTPSKLSATGHDCGNTCHTKVEKLDYMFTAYPKR
jgi:hypothetical protein